MISTPQDVRRWELETACSSIMNFNREYNMSIGMHVGMRRVGRRK